MPRTSQREGATAREFLPSLRTTDGWPRGLGRHGLQCEPTSSRPNIALSQAPPPQQKYPTAHDAPGDTGRATPLPPWPPHARAACADLTRRPQPANGQLRPPRVLECATFLYKRGLREFSSCAKFFCPHQPSVWARRGRARHRKNQQAIDARRAFVARAHEFSLKDRLRKFLRHMHRTAPWRAGSTIQAQLLCDWELEAERISSQGHAVQSGTSTIAPDTDVRAMRLCNQLC